MGNRKIYSLFLFAMLMFSAVQAQQIQRWKMKEVKDFIAQSDSVLVVSFWAIFCKPCIQEIPYLESISQKYANNKVKVLLVSLDLPFFYPEKIETFIAKNKYTSQVVWLDENNADYFCPMIDKSWSGSIPATLIVNTKKHYSKFFEQQLKPEEFEEELKKAL